MAYMENLNRENEIREASSDEKKLLDGTISSPIKKQSRLRVKLMAFLFRGWKKDLKKIGILFMALSTLVVVVGLILFFFGDFLRIRADVYLKKINYKEYGHIAPDFSFRYPDYYEVDTGEGKNYGVGYVTGFKLKTDTRTGCDVRMSKTGINFKKTDREIGEVLAKDISKTAKDFNLVESKRIEIGGEEAFSLEFTFTDPLGSRAHLNQVLTGKNNEFFILICGSGDYRYSYFQKDFQNFFDSWSWKKSL